MVKRPDHGKIVNNPTEKPGLSLNFNAPVALIGGGDITPEMLNLVQNRANNVVGADGGGDVILSNGMIPDAVIGDLDSFSAAGQQAIPSHRILRVTEQDSTDFEKALRHVTAPLILAAGFTGARLDHELAAFHALVRFAEKPVILIGAHDICLHLPRAIRLDLPKSTRVSIYPLDAITVGLHGLKWSFDALDLHPARRIGTSNEALGGEIAITSDGPGGLLILPVDALDVAIDALAQADFHSPRA